MKKTFSIFLIATIASFLSCKQNNKNKIEWFDLKLNGKVKTLTETWFKVVNVSGKAIKSDTIHKTITFFNEKGLMTEFYNYEPIHTLLSRQTFIYNDKGKLIEYNLYKPDGILEEKRTYKYDDKGNRINCFFDSSLFFTSKFDDNGNEIECIETNNNIKYKDIYKYDDKGNRIEEAEYVSGDSLSHIKTYKYDDKGNKIEEKRIFYNSNEQWQNKFITYKYNEKGDMIELNSSNLEGKLSFKLIFNYEYDKNNNFIRRTSYLNGTPNNIIEHEIEYY